WGCVFYRPPRSDPNLPGATRANFVSTAFENFPKPRFQSNTRNVRTKFKAKSRKPIRQFRRQKTIAPNTTASLLTPTRKEMIL
ncbi:MAG: hypothetical protein ACI8W3_001945, partial [Myxococcota bacterium]